MQKAQQVAKPSWKGGCASQPRGYHLPWKNIMVDKVSQSSLGTRGAWLHAKMPSPPSLKGVVVRLNHGVSEDALLGVDRVQVFLVQGGQARLDLGDAALSEAGLDAILYLLEDLWSFRLDSMSARQGSQGAWIQASLHLQTRCSPASIAFIAFKESDRLPGPPDCGQADRLAATSCCVANIPAGGSRKTCRIGGVGMVLRVSTGGTGARLCQTVLNGLHSAGVDWHCHSLADLGCLLHLTACSSLQAGLPSAWRPWLHARCMLTCTTLKIMWARHTGIPQLCQSCSLTQAAQLNAEALTAASHSRYSAACFLCRARSVWRSTSVTCSTMPSLE